MSTDCTAILFCGFPLPRLAIYYGDLNEQWRDERKPPEPHDRSDYKTPEWDEWRARLYAWEKTPENVAIDWCGSEEDDEFYVHCKGLTRHVYWSAIEKVESLDIPPDAQQHLDAFCDRFNIPKGKAGWYLTSRYF